MKYPEFTLASLGFILLLPLFFVFHGYVEIYPFIPEREAAGLLLRYVAASAVTFIIFLFLFRSFPKAALFSFLLLTFYFFFGSVYDAVIGMMGTNFFTGYTFTILVNLFLLTYIFYRLYRSTRSFKKPVRYMNILLLVLILLDVVALFYSSGRKVELSAVSRNDLSPCDSCPKPDVYLIVADEYAGKEALQQIFGFNNNVFEQALQQRGFHLVRNSKSNYNSTPFSISSLLNYNYLPLKEPYNLLQKTREVIYSIRHSSVPAFFAANGYRIANQSVFDLVDQPTQSIQIFKETKTKFIRSQTLLQRIDKDLTYMLKTKMHLPEFLENKLAIYDNYNNNRNLFENTLEITRQQGVPKFVYTHLIMPHFPYYFNAAGQPTSDKTLFDIHDKQGYIGFLQYTNGQLLKLIDSIQKNSPTPPIIILISDHGFRSYDIKQYGESYQFTNFCAVSLPGKNYEGFYDGLSNVNFFRVLLNTSFNQNLPILPDSSVIIKPYHNSKKVTF